MLRFRFALLVVGFLTGSAFATSPNPNDLTIPPQELSKARNLVRMLGSDVFRERENAQAELTKMGRLAKPVLSDALATDPDPEVRSRAARLLPRAAADDLKARLETFLADTDGKYNHHLPGWAELRKVAGSERSTRDLFVEMTKSAANMELLASLERSADVAGRAIADRRYTLYQILLQQYQSNVAPATARLQLPDIATLLLAESVVPTRYIPQMGQLRYVTGVTFLQQNPAASAVMSGNMPHADAFKKIVGGWLDTRVDPMDLSNLAYIATSQLKDFKETLPLLRRIATTESVVGSSRGRAITELVRLKGKDEIPNLKALLKNESEMMQVWMGNVAGVVNNNVSFQMRDLALAQLVALTGQSMQDYGFTFRQGIGESTSAAAFGSYAFVTEEARTAAFQKWDAWEKKNAKK